MSQFGRLMSRSLEFRDRELQAHQHLGKRTLMQTYSKQTYSPPHHPWLLLFLCFYSFYLLFLRSIWYTFLRIQSEMVRWESFPDPQARGGSDCTAFQMQIGAPLAAPLIYSIHYRLLLAADDRKKPLSWLLPVLKKPCPRPLSYEALASSLLPKYSQP